MRANSSLVTKEIVLAVYLIWTRGAGGRRYHEVEGQVPLLHPLKDAIFTGAGRPGDDDEERGGVVDVEVGGAHVSNYTCVSS
jgi:hypothetical protein